MGRGGSSRPFRARMILVVSVVQGRCLVPGRWPGLVCWCPFGATGERRCPHATPGGQAARRRIQAGGGIDAAARSVRAPASFEALLVSRCNSQNDSAIATESPQQQ